MIIDPTTLDRRTRNRLVNGLVMPRPIAWVSTLASDGTPNLAPFSFFGAFSFDPPTIGIGPGSRDGVNKDTQRNIKASGQFVVNLVSRELAELANASSAECDSEIDEWQVIGLEGVPAETVAPMVVARAPAALECHVRAILDLGEPDRQTNSLIVASVARVHIADHAMDGLTPIAEALDLVGRMGGDQWCTTRDRFSLPRPVSRKPAEVKTQLAEDLARTGRDRRTQLKAR